MNFGSYTPEETLSHRPRVIVLNELNEVVRSDAAEAAAPLSVAH
jgi:aspartate 1-decarboxylase